jgi:hypothetical protein
MYSSPISARRRRVGWRGPDFRLHICTSIVVAHGGRIFVRLIPGHIVRPHVGAIPIKKICAGRCNAILTTTQPLHVPDRAHPFSGPVRTIPLLLLRHTRDATARLVRPRIADSYTLLRVGIVSNATASSRPGRPSPQRS